MPKYNSINEEQIRFQNLINRAAKDRKQVKKMILNPLPLNSQVNKNTPSNIKPYFFHFFFGNG